jgi:mannose-6-phosphate isomerase-like protein (cupin superfamily)
MSQPIRSCVTHVAEAQAGITGSPNGRSVRLLRRANLNVVLGTPGCPNEQTHHEQDEIYIVIRGRGVVFHNGKRNSFECGDFLFVAAATRHTATM